MGSPVIYVAMVTAVLMLAVDGTKPAKLMITAIKMIPATTTTTPKRTTPKTTTPYPTSRTTDLPGVNLNGKMFTLSDSGGISFFPPHSSFAPRFHPGKGIKEEMDMETYKVNRCPCQTTTTRRPRTTTTPRPFTTTTRRPFTTTTHRPLTTLPARSGVSVCLRYATDLEGSSASIFTLSPSSSSLTLTASSSKQYTLALNGYYYLYLRANKFLWPLGSQSVWTSVCLSVDTVKRVAQVFEDSFMSIRKILPTAFVWTGSPVIDISGFDGQVTDIQVWDYPVSYREIFYYMTSRPYRSYGNILTWSHISFSLRGRALLEDSYDQPAQEPISMEERTKKTLHRALKPLRKL